MTKRRAAQPWAEGWAGPSFGVVGWARAQVLAGGQSPDFEPDVPRQGNFSGVKWAVLTEKLPKIDTNYPNFLLAVSCGPFFCYLASLLCSPRFLIFCLDSVYCNPCLLYISRLGVLREVKTRRNSAKTCKKTSKTCQ